MKINVLRNISAVFVLVGVIVLSSCGGSVASDPHHTFDSDGAKTSAQDYYQLLVNGQTRDYVNAISASDTMDSTMYNQMCDLVSQYLAHEDEVHHGLKAATATGDSLNIQDSLATVFLDVTYGDSTTEHISLPLKFHNGMWRIK